MRRAPASSSGSLELRVLGELSVLRGGEPVRLPQSRKTRALLAYLALTERPQRRSRLCSLLWDVADDPRGALRWSLSKLRPLVDQPGAPRIVTDGDTVAFDLAGAQVDLFRARAAAAAGVNRLDDARLRAIADSYRGELLEGLDMSDFDEYQAWCVAAREEARALQATVLRTLCGRLGDQPEAALPYARALVAIEPVDEQVRARLVGLLAAAGRQAEARHQCDAGVRQLRELGAPLTGALAAAERALSRRGGPAASMGVASDPAADATAVVDGPLVGRRAELARVTSILDRVVRHGKESIALLSGEPGVGKTRLLAQLIECAREQGAVVLFGRAYEVERGRPFGAWIDALRGAPDVRQSALAGELAPLLPELVAPADESSRERMFAAVVDLLAGMAGQAPLVALAIDDVQWIDRASAELLHLVARRLRGLPLLVALTARAGETVDNGPLQVALRSLRREQLLEDLEVGPLSRSDTEALVAAVAPSVDGAQVFELCAGNPLFALELARSGLRLEGHLPRTLSEVVRERVARLSTEACDVLRWASALGPSAAIDRLSALTELGGDVLVAALELLERHALLRVAGGVYTFGHDVVRHVIYSELSEPRRRLMHGKIAHGIGMDSVGDEASAAEIAHHATLAGDRAMAAGACVAAGRRSLRLFARSDALALARLGFRHVQELGEPERTKLAIELWAVRLAAEVPDRPDEVCAELDQLAGRALDQGELDCARIAFRLLSYLRWEGGHAGDALRYSLHAADLTLGAEGVQRVAALAEAARCLVRLDRELPQAEAMCLEARAVASRLRVQPPALPDAEGMLRAYEGKREQASRAFEESASLARQAQDRLAEFEALENLTMLELLSGDAVAAGKAARRILRIGPRLREGSEGPTSRALAAIASYAAGDAGARAEVDEAFTALRVADAKQRLSFALLATATIDLERGQVAAARACAQEGLRLSRVLKHRSYVALSRALLVRASRAAGDDDGAEAERAALRGENVERLASYARAEVLRVLQ
jgi:DNA-binding SARP family transcriptional activator